MAHGFINYRGLKHGQVLDYQYLARVRQIGSRRFWKNQKFIWQIFKEVADKHGVEIPRHWVAAELMKPKHRYLKRRHNYFVLEPLGPTIRTNNKFNTNQLFDAANSTEATLFSYNWYKTAENFLMVGNGTGYPVVEDGLLCEKWRVVQVSKLTNME